MIGVKTLQENKSCFCSVEDLKDVKLEKEDLVVIDTEGFIELAVVTTKSEQKVYNELSPILKKVIRKALPQDKDKLTQLHEKAKQSIALVKKIVGKHNSDMKIVSCCFSLDESKMLISYTSENRVDFRELVKELAGQFRTRIEMRQIGDRDEARAIGGLGPCGKPNCCKQFLGDFAPVSIKMAKNQNLSLNPAKISGICGRLFCCLSYENAHYAETQGVMPKIGSSVRSPEGEGPVVYNDLLKRRSTIRITAEDGTTALKEFDIQELVFTKNAENRGCGGCKNEK